MKTRKGELPLVMIKMEVMTRVMVVMIATAAIADIMMTAASIVRITTT